MKMGQGCEAMLKGLLSCVRPCYQKKQKEKERRKKKEKKGENKKKHASCRVSLGYVGYGSMFRTPAVVPRYPSARGTHSRPPNSERLKVMQRLTVFMSFWHKLQTLWIADMNNDLANEEGARDVPGIVYYPN